MDYYFPLAVSPVGNRVLTTQALSRVAEFAGSAGNALSLRPKVSPSHWIK